MRKIWSKGNRLVKIISFLRKAAISYYVRGKPWIMISKKLTHLFLRGGLVSLLFSSPLLGMDQDVEEVVEDSSQPACSGHCINFNDVPVIEFIRFVSKISQENFIYDSSDLNFNISLSTGKSVGPDVVVKAL